MPCLCLTCLICAVRTLAHCQIVSYLLDLPEKDEEEVERAQINNFDTLWGETGRSAPSPGSVDSRSARATLRVDIRDLHGVDNLWVVMRASEPCSADMRAPSCVSAAAAAASR